MCGLSGYVVHDADRFPTTETQKRWEKLYDLSMVRGRDAGGYSVLQTNGELKTFKKLDPTDLILPSMVGTHWGMANARAIPEPEWLEHPNGPRVQDSQPAVVGSWAVVLNGNISNDKEVRKLHGLACPSNVDTFVIPALLGYKLETWHTEKVARIFKDSFRGSFACLLGNARSPVAFGAVANFVPLYYMEETDVTWFATMREWLEEIQVEGKEIKQVGPYQLVTFIKGRVTDIVDINPTPTKDSVLVVCSSGLDSSTIARLYQVLGYEMELLHFDYGCAATESEVKSFFELAARLDLMRSVWSIPQLYSSFRDSRLLRGDTELKDGVTWLQDAETSVSYVPVRNLLFATLAAGLAEKKGYQKIVQGLNLVDGAAYPDNQLTYLRGLDNLLPYALNWNTRMRFRAPLVHLVKSEIVELALLIGAPLLDSWSCYRKGKNRCGVCGPCSYRMLAFKKLKKVDPVEYESCPNDMTPQKFWEGCQPLSNEEMERLKSPLAQTKQVVKQLKDSRLWFAIKGEI